MMKKLLTGIISVLILCVALAGCGGQTAQTDDLAYIQEKGTLKIGITLFQPMNYYDESEPDKLVGFDTELAEAVCEKLGVTPEFVVIDWDQKVIELQSKNIDCIWNGMTILEELKENIDFSMPYSGNMQVCVVSRDNAQTFQSTADMTDAKIAVEAESAGQKAVEGDESLGQAELNFSRCSERCPDGSEGRHSRCGGNRRSYGICFCGRRHQLQRFDRCGRY